MLTSKIFLKNFSIKIKNLKVKKNLISIINEKNPVLESLSKNYKDNYSKKLIKTYSKKSKFRLIGMGGSTLGAQAIYDFLKKKIKKEFSFIDNLNSINKKNKENKITNLIISKSGNTIETIINTTILVKKNDNNIFITENKKNYLYDLAKKLKAEVVHHNNYIGGRYSVLSEVGMLPAELMGLNKFKFRQLNSLIKNKNFFNSIVLNVSSILHFIKKKKI